METKTQMDIYGEIGQYFFKNGKHVEFAALTQNFLENFEDVEKTKAFLKEEAEQLLINDPVGLNKKFEENERSKDLFLIATGFKNDEHDTFDDIYYPIMDEIDKNGFTLELEKKLLLEIYFEQYSILHIPTKYADLKILGKNLIVEAMTLNPGLRNYCVEFGHNDNLIEETIKFSEKKFKEFERFEVIDFGLSEEDLEGIGADPVVLMHRRGEIPEIELEDEELEM